MKNEVYKKIKNGQLHLENGNWVYNRTISKQGEYNSKFDKKLRKRRRKCKKLEKIV